MRHRKWVDPHAKGGVEELGEAGRKNHSQEVLYGKISIFKKRKNKINSMHGKK